MVDFNKQSVRLGSCDSYTLTADQICEIMKNCCECHKQWPFCWSLSLIQNMQTAHLRLCRQAPLHLPPAGCVLSPLLYLLITNAWPPTAPTPTFSLLMAQLLLWSTDTDRHLFIVRLKLTFVRPHGLLFWSVQPRTATTTIKVTFPFSCSCFSLGFLWTCSCWAAVSLTCIAHLKCRHTELFLMAAT